MLILWIILSLILIGLIITALVLGYEANKRDCEKLNDTYFHRRD
jgi:hypothetical protein